MSTRIRALVSDIHANFLAWMAVKANIQSQNVTEIACLGDFIGYGPEPVKCALDIMTTADFTILGNHDQASLFDPDGFNPTALQSVWWTREQIESAPRGDEIFEFIGNLPTRKSDGQLLFVHGSPYNPTEQYLFPEDIWDHRNRMETNFALLKDHRYAFCGHTHIPGIFDNDGDDFHFRSQEDLGEDWIDLSRHEKAIINVGSVGQPRDCNPKACYLLVEEDGDRVRVRYCRVAYDVDATAQLIFDNSEIADFLGQRLKEGR